MEPLPTALWLLRRHFDLGEAMCRPDGMRPVDERALYRLNDSLQQFPAAMRVILDATRRRGRPLDTVTLEAVETGQ